MFFGWFKIYSNNNQRMMPTPYWIRYFSLFLVVLSVLISAAFSQDMTSLYCDSAIVLNNLGADHATEGDWELAKANLIMAIHYTKKCNPNDSSELIPALLNLGGIFGKTWQFEKALEFFIRAKKIYETSSVKNNEYLSFIYSRMGRVYSSLGDYSKAEEYYNNSLLLMPEIKSYSELNKTSLIFLYNSMGILNRRMKRYQKAIEHYNNAVKLSRKLDPSMLSLLYGNIANTYRELKEYKTSEEYFKKAIAEKQVLNSKDSDDFAIILTDYSSLLLDERKLDQVSPILEQANALGLRIWGEINPQLSEIQINTGRYFELSGNYDKAIFWYQRSILSLSPGGEVFIPGKGTVPENVISKQHLLVSLKAIANVYQLKYRETNSLSYLNKSLGIYEQSVHLIELIRHGYLSNDSRLFLAENEKVTLNAALNVALELFNKTADDKYQYLAFEISEKSKAALLLSSIQSNAAIKFGGIPEFLGNKEKYLLRNISMSEENIYEEEQETAPDTRKLLKWKNNLLKLKADYEELIRNLEKNYPKYYQLKYRNSIISREKLLTQLKNGYNLIEYNLSDTSIIIFIANRKGINSVAVPVNELYSTAISGILKQLQTFDPTRHSYNDIRQFGLYANRLYKTLLQPAEKYLVSDKIIIVPDEILAYIPFEILLYQVPDARETNYRNLSYLIKKYTISYSYSASILFDDQLLKNQRGNRKVLAIAPLYNSSPGGKSMPLVYRRYLEYLYPLPGANEEVTLITKLLNGLKLTDSMATEKAFKKYAPDFGILHLAMHTIIDNQNPMYSKLVFTQWPVAPDEGLLNTYELYNMDLNAMMVVLSACRSGDGILQKGEGIMSLARGFLYAGCSSIIMTLWNVEDKTGLEIMNHFYHNIKKGKSKNIALRLAKLNYLANAAPPKTHPYYWAGYLQIGEQSAIFWPSVIKIMMAIVISIFIVFTVLVFIYRKYGEQVINFQRNHEHQDRI
jgi:CHAT domain-containing protein